MILKFHAIILAAVLIIQGCSAGRTVKGDYYLSQADYKQGIESFKKDIENDPESAEANYFLGRLYLADSQGQKALPFLKKAVALKPENAEYWFWTGMAHAANKMRKQEWECYEEALKLDPDHLKSRLYLAHTQLERNLYEEALNNYVKVLKKAQDEPSALFNRALALNELKREEEEKAAWKEYLGYYPKSPMSANAVRHLNLLGDFSFKNYLIGARTVPLPRIDFIPLNPKLSGEAMTALDDLGEVLTQKKDLAIHIVVYHKNSKALAEQRAKQIKLYLLERYPQIPAHHLKVSWFDTPEIIRIENKEFFQDESVNFITAQ